MNITFEGKNQNIAVLRGGQILSVQDALDLIAETWQKPGCAGAVIFREALSPDFFALRTRLAGEMLQKFSNYRIKLAIVGDFSDFAAGPMHDFIFESNEAGHTFFASTLEAAIEKLEGLSDK